MQGRKPRPMLWPVRFAVVLVAVTGCGPATTPAVAASDGGAAVPPRADRDQPLFLDGVFPLGVFSQPASMFQTWVDRGCNAMFEIPQGEDRAAWDRQAQRLGLYTIRPPIGDPAADIGRTDLLAWSMPDEPDVEANNVPCGGNCVELCESLATRWRSVDPQRPLFVNVAGPNVLLPAACDYCNGPGDEPPSPDCYPDNGQCYPRILATADWIGQDTYPVSGWLPSESLRDDVSTPGKTLDKLRGWTDKPMMAVIELSDQRLGIPGAGTRAPTPAEVRAQIWISIVHGARGIFYFPHAFNPFEWDAATPAVIDQVRELHPLITELAPVLQGPVDPDSIEVTAPEPLHVGWRVGADATYVIAINPTRQPLGAAALTIDGTSGETANVYDEARTVAVEGGVLRDDFDALDVHIYALPNPAADAPQRHAVGALSADCASALASSTSYSTIRSMR